MWSGGDVEWVARITCGIISVGESVSIHSPIGSSVSMSRHGKCVHTHRILNLRQATIRNHT